MFVLFRSLSDKLDYDVLPKGTNELTKQMLFIHSIV